MDNQGQQLVLATRQHTRRLCHPQRTKANHVVLQHFKFKIQIKYRGTSPFGVKLTAFPPQPLAFEQDIATHEYALSPL
jgi:hypothetical protein